MKELEEKEKQREAAEKEKEVARKRKLEEEETRRQKMRLAPKQKPVGQAIPALEVQQVPKPADDLAGYCGDLGDLVQGKTIVLVGVPAAFDPLSDRQVLSFKKHRQHLQAAGIQNTFVVSCNDAVVMHAWQNTIDEIGHMSFLSDPSGNVAKTFKVQDKELAQLGQRLRRFTLLVQDGTIKFAVVT